MRNVLISLFLVLVLFGSCSKKNNIIGTWEDAEGITWVFIDDGKLAYANLTGNSKMYQYSVSDIEKNTELNILGVENKPKIALFRKSIDQKYNIEYSKDRKTLKLTGGENIDGWKTAGPGFGTNQLTRISNSASINLFNGRWSATLDGELFTTVIEGSKWVISTYDIYNNEEYNYTVTATYSDDNTANIIYKGASLTVTVLEDNLLFSLDEMELFTLKRR
jgi:hypothetical protein